MRFHFPLPMEQGHDPPRSHTPLQQRRGNGIAVFLQATTGELLPTFCEGSSTLFPSEKAAIICFENFRHATMCNKAVGECIRNTSIGFVANGKCLSLPIT